MARLTRFEQRLAGVRTDSVAVQNGRPYRIPKRKPTQAVLVGQPSGSSPSSYAAKRTAFCSRQGKKVQRRDKGAALHQCKKGRRYA